MGQRQAAKRKRAPRAILLKLALVKLRAIRSPIPQPITPQRATPDSDRSAQWQENARIGSRATPAATTTLPTTYRSSIAAVMGLVCVANRGGDGQSSA